MIADAERAVALAGIMGGARQRGRAETTDCCSRRRTSSRSAILASSERLRLRSDASTCGGVDPDLAEQAAVYASD